MRCRARPRCCSRASASRWSRCRGGWRSRWRGCRRNSRSHCRRGCRRGCSRRRAGRLARPRTAAITGNWQARSNINHVNAPAFAGATRVTGHSPAQPTLDAKKGKGDHRRNESTRVAAPSLTTSNRATAISANRAVIAPHGKGPAGRKNILKRISTISADFKHSAVEAQVRILARRFKIEVLSKGQFRSKKSKV